MIIDFIAQYNRNNRQRSQGRPEEIESGTLKSLSDWMKIRVIISVLALLSQKCMFK